MKKYFQLYILFISLFLEATELTLSGNPQPLTISQATAGENPISAIDTSTTFSLRIPSNTKIYILGSLDSTMPPHTNLKIRMNASKSKPSTSLNVSPQKLSSLFKEGQHDNIPITYEYSATVAAGVLPPTAKIVFFTVVESTD